MNKKMVAQHQMDQFSSQFGSEDPTIIIGYYNLKGKAQVCRLLCEYFHVQYKDQLLTLTQWDRLKNSKAKSWSFNDLPFLKEADFVVTQSVPICLYIVNRFGNQEFLGKNPKDQALIDMYLWTIEAMTNVISINCQKKTESEILKFKEEQWLLYVCPRLKKYEEKAQEDDWFMGYLTIVDFSIYELINYMEKIFINKLGHFKKLKNIAQKVGKIPQIENYENSPRAIREWCPTKLLQELKLKNSLYQGGNQKTLIKKSSKNNESSVHSGKSKNMSEKEVKSKQ